MSGKQEFITDKKIFDNGSCRMWRTNLGRVSVDIDGKNMGILPSVNSVIRRYIGINVEPEFFNVQ